MPASYSGSTPFVAQVSCPPSTRWRGTFPYHVFSLTLGGGATYAVADGQVDIVPGDLLHFAPQAQQDWSADGARGWKVVYLIIALPDAIRQLIPTPDLAPGFGRIHLASPDRPRFARIFQDMLDCNEHAASLRDPLILNLLEQLLLRLHGTKPPDTGDARVGQARAFLHASLEAPIVLADVARAAHLSRARLCALFKTHLDTTPMAYLERLRLEQAARHLLFSSESISRIAERFGYQERGYFEKRFKRHWSMTPKAYRSRGAQPTEPGARPGLRRSRTPSPPDA